MKKKELKKMTRLTILILFTLFFGISSLYTLLAYQKPATQKAQVPVYKLTQTGSTEYRVHLKPNNLYSKTVLDSGKIYLANFIDKIEVDFNYKFEAPGETKISGTYNIIAVLEAYEVLSQQPGEDKPVKVWEKEFPLAPQAKFEYKAKQGEFKKSILIDHAYFNRFVDAVNKVAETNTGETRLLVKCNIATEASTPKGSAKETITPVLTIPVGEKMFEIKEAVPTVKTVAQNTTKTIAKPDVRRERILFSAISAALLILLAGFYFATKTSAGDPEDKTMADIFKKYGDRIVKMAPGKDAPSTDKIINTDSMDGLVKVADELGKPIFYKAYNGKKHHAFYVLDGLLCYQFELTPEFCFSNLAKNTDALLSPQPRKENL